MYNEALEASLAAVGDRLRDALNSDVELLYDASHHIVDSGGKRVRPRLMMLVYLACGGTDLDEVVPLAAALELVHTATLVHDDINDHSNTRRGRPTINSKWGRTFALLTGDYLFTKVYEMMAPYGVAFNTVFANACVQLVEGETLQALAAKEGEMDRETYKRIITRKTASLFEAGARMGAMLAGAGDEMVESMAGFGRDVGLTFQIVDDILDIVGDPNTLGKPVGMDLIQQRGVMALTHGPGNGAAPVAEMDAVATLKARVRESGALDLARMEAREMARRAREALYQLPNSAAREELEQMVTLVLEREQ
jgi:geranylgeranyl pyrophosphate synthase